ncbi:alpha/beta hydrolase family protein [Listeria seeligeri]|uniref:Alpha/beta hydrolase n=1 Tax=Listeria seeligeri TaxID=1640 RepID=A0A7X0X1L2_LISSE|nr:dipeptidyl aminopeptidase [Listeria seeligeri]KKD49214.1 dipeptidyl aminopeptidase [Listeria seeligeri]MBC1485961.1 alpha/beta hydrolase [Listeria seeligeri]MBC1578509.1 alpha/beta hydrolase [Listeria seeligeri]MBC1580560.1 alpha/beta hydrolase [Listeria seeligeri]MBC1586971.1 alpha/beta hydrolase [Listeria seeligeri]
MKRHFFKTFEFEFETTRLLWYTPSGGADYGEVATVTEKIKDGNYESWYLEWSKFAKTLEDRATHFYSDESKGNALFRSSRYYQAAEFFLHPKDSRKIVVYNKSVELFYQALAIKKIAYTEHDITYARTKLRTLFFKTSQPSKGTFYICGGFDALLEELYFTNVKATLANGYDVVLYEGPGQSDVIRKAGLPFTAAWNNVVNEVINYYQDKIGLLGEKIGVGISLGGLLLSRAASLDNSLFDRIILYNYFPSMLDSLKKPLPFFLHSFLDKGFPPPLEKIASFYIAHSPFLNWQVEHAKWVFGANSLNNLLAICGEFDETVAYEKLHTDTLVFVAKNENYYNYQLGNQFFEQIPAKHKKLILFDKEHFSSDLHCQNGAGYDGNDQIFLWLNE